MNSIYYISHTNHVEQQIQNWKILPYTRDQFEDMMKETDTKNNSTFFQTYSGLTPELKTEYIKYYILYHSPGQAVFSYDPVVDENNVHVIQELYEYCKHRNIGLLEVSDITIVCFDNHPELLSMLSDEPFRPLSFSLRKDRFHKSLKTVISSFDCKNYLYELKKGTKSITPSVQCIQDCVKKAEEKKEETEHRESTPYTPYISTAMYLGACAISFTLGFFIGRRSVR